MVIGGEGLLSALLILGPGFLTFLFFARYSAGRLGISSNAQILVSLVFSGLIALLFFHCNRINTAENLSNFFFSNPLRALIYVIFLSFGLAILVSLLIEYDPVLRFLQTRIFQRGSVYSEAEETWDAFLSSNILKPVMVTLHNEKQFVGILTRNSEEGEERALALEKAREVEDYNVEGEPVHGPEAVELYLSGSDIERVEVLEDDRRPVKRNDSSWQASEYSLVIFIIIALSLFFYDCHIVDPSVGGYSWLESLKAAIW